MSHLPPVREHPLPPLDPPARPCRLPPPPDAKLTDALSTLTTIETATNWRQLMDAFSLKVRMIIFVKILGGCDNHYGGVKRGDVRCLVL